MQLSNENFNDDLDALIESAELDEAQETKLEREFAREYHLITRDFHADQRRELQRQLAFTEEADIDEIMNQVGDLLDDSIATKGYIIHATEQTSLLDRRKKQQSRAAVYTTVKNVLDELPRAYTPELYQQKCDSVYQHVFCHRNFIAAIGRLDVASFSEKPKEPLGKPAGFNPTGSPGGFFGFSYNFMGELTVSQPTGTVRMALRARSNTWMRALVQSRPTCQHCFHPFHPFHPCRRPCRGCLAGGRVPEDQPFFDWRHPVKSTLDCDQTQPCWCILDQKLSRQSVRRVP